MNSTPSTTRTSHGILSVFLLGILCACGTKAPTPPPNIPVVPGTSLNGALMAGIAVQPKVASPGSTVHLTVHVTDANLPSVTLLQEHRGEAVTLLLTATSDGAVANASVVAPNVLGDWHLQVKGESAHGPVSGYAVVQITESPPCSPQDTLEANQCMTPKPGHRLQKTGSLLVNIPPDDRSAPGARLMIHPRSVQRIDDLLIGCHTDSVGVIPLSALALSAKDGNNTTTIAEALMTDAGLDACENIVLDPTRRLAMVSSRGDSGKPGGLSTWSIPTSSSGPMAPATHLDTWLDEQGLEGMALRDDRLYAAAKPNRVLVFSVDHEGIITLINEVVIPGLTSAWHIAADEDRLYVTDAGNDDHDHIHVDEDHGGGHLLVLDRSHPDAPAPLGIGDTNGSSKGLAILPNHVVAVASGAAGIDLFDATQPWSPTRMATINTPHSVTSLAFHQGYLLAADWETIRLYDPTERGTLRLLDGSDFNSEPSLNMDGHSSPFAGLIAASFVSVNDDGFVIAEFDHVMTGTITPGQDAPRLTLQDRRRVVSAPKTGAPVSLALRMRNDGRAPLWVTLKSTVYVTTDDAPLILGPGEEGAVDVQVVGLDQPDAPETIVLVSNDPTTPERSVSLVLVDEGYTEGEQAPHFELPIVQNCANGTCPPPSECFRLSEALSLGKPIFLAFFSTW